MGLETGRTKYRKEPVFSFSYHPFSSPATSWGPPSHQKHSKAVNPWHAECPNMRVQREIRIADVGASLGNTFDRLLAFSLAETNYILSMIFVMAFYQKKTCDLPASKYKPLPKFRGNGWYRTTTNPPKVKVYHGLSWFIIVYRGFSLHIRNHPHQRLASTLHCLGLPPVSPWNEPVAASTGHGWLQPPKTRL